MALSYRLRHNPLGLQLFSDGSASITEAAALLECPLEELRHVAMTSWSHRHGCRFEVWGDRVRVRRGQSLQFSADQVAAPLHELWS